jgi:hypothetical protein
VTLGDVRLGKSVTLIDICYEWNTKAEIVHVEHARTISSVVSMTSSSPLNGRFSAFQRNKKVPQVTDFTVLLLLKQMYLYLHILHMLYFSCLNSQYLYWRHCWHIIWTKWCIVHSFFRVIMKYWCDICHRMTESRIPSHDSNTTLQKEKIYIITTQVQNNSTTQCAIKLIFERIKISQYTAVYLKLITFTCSNIFIII